MHGTGEAFVYSWLRCLLLALLNFLLAVEIAPTFSLLHNVVDLQGMRVHPESRAHTAPLFCQKYTGNNLESLFH